MKRSMILEPGIYQWEWLEDRIDVTKWNQVPLSTHQWIVFNSEGYLQGTNNNNIQVIEFTKLNLIVTEKE